MEREIKKVGWNYKAKESSKEAEKKQAFNEMDRERGTGEFVENGGPRGESVERTMGGASDKVVIEQVNNKADKTEETPSDFDAMVPNFESDVVVKPISDDELKKKPVEAPRLEKTATNRLESAKIALANNADFSVATIAKEANRIKERNEDEVFISLR